MSSIGSVIGAETCSSKRRMVSMSSDSTGGIDHTPSLEKAKIDEGCPWCNGWGLHKCPGPDRSTASGNESSEEGVHDV